MSRQSMNLALPQWAALPDIGLYMDQVITLMERTFAPEEMTKSMVNNYVKFGLLKRPVGKKYDREHLARLVMIGVLKQALSLEDIARLLHILCAQGTQAGYERFCATAQAISTAVEAGGLGHAHFEETDTPQGRAVAAGVTSAVCAMYARAMLAQVDADEVQA